VAISASYFGVFVARVIMSNIHAESSFAATAGPIPERSVNFGSLLVVAISSSEPSSFFSHQNG